MYKKESLKKQIVFVETKTWNFIQIETGIYLKPKTLVQRHHIYIYILIVRVKSQSDVYTINIKMMNYCVNLENSYILSC